MGEPGNVEDLDIQQVVDENGRAVDGVYSASKDGATAYLTRNLEPGDYFHENEIVVNVVQLILHKKIFN